jgi:hypothetical protein
VFGRLSIEPDRVGQGALTRNSRKALSIGLGVLVGALVTGFAVAASTGVGAASPQPADLAPTARGTASSGAA